MLVEIAGIPMEGLEARHPLAPKPLPYCFRRALVEEVKIGIDLGLNVMLAGPQGCGKTSLPIQVAAALGRPCVRFNMDGETRVSQLRGQQRPAAVDGVLTLVFELGLLAQAMKEGWWVVLDEIDAALPAVLFVLQPVLEAGGRTLRIPETGELIEAHRDFRVFATSNTVGYRSSQRARHAGTRAMNSAFVDRFGMVIAVDYPSQQEEMDILKMRVPSLVGMPLGVLMLEGIAKVAADLRSADRFVADFSTRRCLQWAMLVASLPNARWLEAAPAGELPYDVLRAAELAVLRKLATPTDVRVAREVIQRVFGYEVAS